MRDEEFYEKYFKKKSPTFYPNMTSNDKLLLEIKALYIVRDKRLKETLIKDKLPGKIKTR